MNQTLLLRTFLFVLLSGLFGQLYAIEEFELLINDQKVGVTSYEAKRLQGGDQSVTTYRFNYLTDESLAAYRKSKASIGPLPPRIAVFIRDLPFPTPIAHEIKVITRLQQSLQISGLTVENEDLQCGSLCQNTLLDQLISNASSSLHEDNIVIFDPLYFRGEVRLSRQSSETDGGDTFISWKASFLSEFNRLKPVECLPDQQAFGAIYTYRLQATYDSLEQLQTMELVYEKYLPAVVGTNATEPSSSRVLKLELQKQLINQKKEGDNEERVLVSSSSGAQCRESDLARLDSGLDSMPSSFGQPPTNAGMGGTNLADNVSVHRVAEFFDRLLAGLLCHLLKNDSVPGMDSVFPVVCQQFMSLRSGSFALRQMILMLK